MGETSTGSENSEVYEYKDPRTGNVTRYHKVKIQSGETAFKVFEGGELLGRNDQKDQDNVVQFPGPEIKTTKPETTDEPKAA